MTDNSKELLLKIKNIPLFNDETFKRGERSQLNNMSSIHYVIYPFLQILGYDVFNPEKLKMMESVTGGSLDVAIYESNMRVLGITVKNYVNTPTIDSLHEAFRDNGLPVHQLMQVPVSVVTNGILYAIYMEGEAVVSFDITNIPVEKADFIFKLLTQSSLQTVPTNPRFQKEVLIESQYGNLRYSTFVKEALVTELNNPSDILVDTLLNSIYSKYCQTLDREEFRQQFKAEIQANAGCLFEIIQEAARTHAHASDTSIDPTPVYTQITPPARQSVDTIPSLNQNPPKTEEEVDYTSLEIFEDDTSAVETLTPQPPTETPVEQAKPEPEYIPFSQPNEDNNGEGLSLTDLLND